MFTSVVVTLAYLRRNRVQQELAETYGVSQPTISRVIAAITPFLGKSLADRVRTAEDLDDHTPYIVDGTLLPCWSWAANPELYSGKHKTTGMNVQVACTLSGHLARISAPIAGSRHDTCCVKKSGVLLGLDPRNWMGDKGYVGNNMITQGSGKVVFMRSGPASGSRSADPTRSDTPNNRSLFAVTAG